MTKGKFGEDGEVFHLAIFAKTGYKLFVFGDEAHRIACTNAWLEVEDKDGKIIFAIPAVEVVAYHWDCFLAKDAFYKFWDKEWIKENIDGEKKNE